jgi:Patatin-like phospholipase/Mycolic acid cyclopropane synthetase
VRFRTVDGELVVGGPPGSECAYVLDVLGANFFTDVVCFGNLGMGEAYMRGDFVMETGRLEDFLTLLLRSRLDEKVGRTSRLALRALAIRLQNVLHSRRESIQQHYDIGTDLFEAFLDPTLTYTCGYARSPDDCIDPIRQGRVGWAARTCPTVRVRRFLPQGRDLAEAEQPRPRARDRDQPAAQPPRSVHPEVRVPGLHQIRLPALITEMEKAGFLVLDVENIARLARRLTGRSIGLSLSGGGARSFAQIGVLEELVTAGITVDRVSGTGMGAFIGALVAQGMDPGEVDARCYEEWVRRNPVNDYHFPRNSLIRGARTRTMLERVFPGSIEGVDPEVPTLAETLFKAMLLSESDSDRRRSFADLLIRPDCSDIGTVEFHMLGGTRERGRRAAATALATAPHLVAWPAAG